MSIKYDIEKLICQILEFETVKWLREIAEKIAQMNKEDKE